MVIELDRIFYTYVWEPDIGKRTIDYYQNPHPRIARGVARVPRTHACHETYPPLYDCFGCCGAYELGTQITAFMDDHDAYIIGTLESVRYCADKRTISRQEWDYTKHPYGYDEIVMLITGEIPFTF